VNIDAFFTSLLLAETFICVVGGVIVQLLLLLLMPLQLRRHSPLSLRSPLSYLSAVEPPSSLLNIVENNVQEAKRKDSVKNR
jgi:hypothetical protein